MSANVYVIAERMHFNLYKVKNGNGLHCSMRYGELLEKIQNSLWEYLREHPAEHIEVTIKAKGYLDE